MVHDFEATGHVLQDLGHVLADLAQALGAAARASAGGGLVSLLAAWQMLGQLAARLLLGRRCRRRSRLQGLGHVGARRRRLDLIELQLQLFDLALDAAGLKTVRRAFYRALAEQGVGREAVVIARLP